MIYKPARHLAAFATTALLAACATTPASVPTSFDAPRNGDDGVVIAQTVLVEGVSSGNTITGQGDDCGGPGLGVVVNTALSGARFLFNKHGEPCEAAQVLFDGRNAVNKRAVDPTNTGLTLNFYDAIGPQAKDSLPSLEPVPTIRLKSELLPTMRPDVATIEPAAGPREVPATASRFAPSAPDPLVATLTSWERKDRIASRESEADAAASRDLDNIVRNTKAETDTDKMAAMMAELRERERQVEEEQRRHTETLARAQQNRAMTEAAHTAWQQKETELQNQLQATQQRVAQFEELSKRLAAEKAAREQQISSLSTDLKAAEAQADSSRRELVLQAAAKIAEAEQLASAAKIEEQQAKLRQAARMKTEAETMMSRALAMNTGGNVVVNGVGAPPAVPMALMSTPVTVVANGQTLPEILSSVLKQAAPQAGPWQAQWQLSTAAQPMLKEKWSLTAEAPVQQVLAQLNQQVKAAYGITLTFSQFNQSQLLVVTDATPPQPEDAE